MDDINKYLEPLPPHMRPGILRYLNDGIIPGSFLKAVLENDLVGALAAADGDNRRIIWDYGNMLWNAFPARGNGCWGSPEALEDWAAIGGLNGIKRGPRAFSRADLGQERAARLATLVNRFGGEGEVVA